MHDVKKDSSCAYSFPLATQTASPRSLHLPPPSPRIAAGMKNPGDDHDLLLLIEGIVDHKGEDIEHGG